MNTRRCWLSSLAVAFALSSSMAQEQESALREAVQVRTDVLLLQHNLRQLATEARRPVRRVIAEGDARLKAADALLAKGRYSEAAKAYGEAHAAYRRVLDAKATLTRLATVRAAVERARVAAAAAPPEQARQAQRLELNADGYEQAGALEATVTELGKALGLYKDLAKAAAQADAQRSAARAAALIERLEAAIAEARKFDAAGILAQLAELTPTEPRIADWREQLAALPAPQETLRVDLGEGIGIDFVLIPQGSFQMGSAEGEWNEKPVRNITFSRPFYLGQFEVTQEQWEVVMGSNPSHHRAPRKPVEQVSWHAAVEFARELSEGLKATFRLPTEAEWEYACRAGTTSQYYWGNAFDEHFAWAKGNSGGVSHETGTREPNAWDLFDMSGNVYEWCADWYADAYPGDAEQTDPKGAASGSLRVFRGGCYCDNSSGACRAAARRGKSPSFKYGSVGFRLVKEIR